VSYNWVATYDGQQSATVVSLPIARIVSDRPQLLVKVVAVAYPSGHTAGLSVSL
jgi:hypothetical protein